MSEILRTADIPAGPHGRIDVDTDHERFAAQLFDVLWDRYRSRVSYVRDYERVIASAGATFVNDHIAFRTLAGQHPLAGISTLSRIFEALGYLAGSCYHFPDKHLNAIHYRHPNAAFPKLFISELRTWELPDDAGETLERLLESHRDPVTRKELRELTQLDGLSEAAHLQLLNVIVDEFHSPPWDPPKTQDVHAVNAHSQYAAWVMVHGYNVNHFTSSVNSHGVESLNDIEKTIAALKDAGVPMKAEIEGEPGSKLRQSATEAVTIDVDVLDGGKPATMPWSYAYFELAERNDVTDPETGKKTRFEGFLGPQATNLFEMTRVRSGR
jgi:hypothetical protein